MDTQQAILPEIYRRFEREQIRFAHPMSIVRMADGEALAHPRALQGAAGVFRNQAATAS
ncbi:MULTISPECIES: hypothetical protein [unclassified Massilia]|uniref:hypothetical protein n=1 Tax=unclassified Massilia TaxID=2609279 RepID=UPI00177FB388|nr:MULTISPECIES: hypothetical protein [unclassified Massilia]MBD8528527.1 hypothetical protein [Massilia sp. CFBP 13647]MBD8671850.1 hypothetical protein [Massilia sp. CFBP 13721]